MENLENKEINLRFKINEEIDIKKVQIDYEISESNYIP